MIVGDVAPVERGTGFAVNLVPWPAHVLPEKALQGSKHLSQPLSPSRLMTSSGWNALWLILVIAIRAIAEPRSPLTVPAAGAAHSLDDCVSHIRTHMRVVLF